MEHLTKQGETLPCHTLNYFCRGKGLNQSIALSRAGVKVRHAGCIGSDGLSLRRTLEQNGVDCSFLRNIDGDSGHAIIQIDPSGQNSIIVFSGANRRLTEAQIDETLDQAQAGDILLMQNETNLGEYLAQAAKKRGLLTAFNPSPIDKALLTSFPFELIDIFLCNEYEAAVLSGADDPDRAAAVLLERYPSARLVITLGARGVLYLDAHDRYIHGIYDVPAVDTVGAGDTFTGFFLGGFTAGRSIPECLKLGSLASSLAVSVLGASNSIPDMKAVLKAQETLQYIEPCVKPH